MIRLMCALALAAPVLSGCDSTSTDAEPSSRSAGCALAPIAPGSHRYTLEHGGQTRSYLVHIPASYTASSAAPLVLNFHGLFLSGETQRGLDEYDDLAEREGIVLAYPDGIDNAWNVGPCCTMSRAVDDVGFARALVTDLAGRTCIDPSRVYAVGYSMGGGLSYALACNAGDVFAAIAPAAFDMLEEMPCAPSRPISVIAFRGTDDPIVPYAGGPSRPPNGLDTTIHFLGAEATFQRWAELDGCRGEPRPDAQGCVSYDACGAGTEVTLCTESGGGHLPGKVDVAWSALQRYTLPR